MTPKFQNALTYSTYLWLDYHILSKGNAFTNFGSNFYRAKDDIFAGFYTYSTPFNQFVSDSSISGATIISGLYINNSFITTGVSGLVSIDYTRGRAYFNTEITGTISGNYAVKDFNIMLADKPEYFLASETKFNLKPKTNQRITGLGENENTVPAIFVSNLGGQNTPYAFGGMDELTTTVRLFVLSDNLFRNDAVASIINDLRGTYIPLISESEDPYNALGGLKSGSYNYLNLASGKVLEGSAAFLEQTNMANYRQLLLREFRDLNPDIYPGIFDLEICCYRYPRR